jgi:hypothetical protein
MIVWNTKHSTRQRKLQSYMVICYAELEKALPEKMSMCKILYVNPQGYQAYPA